jgi:hypothetical protein
LPIAAPKLTYLLVREFTGKVYHASILKLFSGTCKSFEVALPRSPIYNRLPVMLNDSDVREWVSGAEIGHALPLAIHPPSAINPTDEGTMNHQGFMAFLLLDA